MIIYLSLIAICLLIVLHVRTRYSESGKLIDKIPGPTPLPFLGNLLTLNLNPVDLWVLFVKKLPDSYYPISRLWLGMSPGVVLFHPEDYKALLSCKKNIDKSHLGYGHFKDIGEDGLIISDGDKWRARRKMLNPAFNPNLLKTYYQIAEENTKHYLMRLKSEGKENVLDLMHEFSRWSFWIICEATMGVPIRNQNFDETRCQDAFHELCEVSFYRCVRPYILNWMMKYLEVGRKQDEALKIIRELVYKIINERRDYHKKNGYKELERFSEDSKLSEDDELGVPKARLSVLDSLLAAERSGLIDAEGVREEVDNVLAAGHETISVSMALTSMLLADNKQIQDAARAEVMEAIERGGGELTINEIQKLDLLDRIIKESLRMFTPACILGRHISHELQLDKYKVPAGTEVVMNLYCLHHNPEFWPQPDKFDPDRFLPENTKERHPFSYIPFSYGLRNCIGQKLAQVEMKIVIAHLLANFYIEPVDSVKNIQFEFFISLRSSRKLYTKLIAIE